MYSGQSSSGTGGHGTSATEVDLEELLNFNRFPDFGNWWIDRSVSRVDWEDDNLKRYTDRIRLFKLSDFGEDIEAKKKILLAGLGCFYKSVSFHSVACLLISAWNLHSAANPTKQCFEVDESCSGDAMREFDPQDHTEWVRNATSVEQIRVPEDYQRLERGAAYLCASALRMVTKTHTNYYNAYNHILSGYRNFYKDDCPIEVRIDLRFLEATRTILQGDYGRYSVIPFIYNFAELEGSDQRMCKMLFEQHIAFSGMHAYKLFTDAADKLNLSPKDLRDMLKHPWINDALDTIIIILDKYEVPPNERSAAVRRGTWKYSRLYDSEIFAHLQTKTCTYLVAILAHLNEMLGDSSDGSGNIWRITHLENMSSTLKEETKEIASIVCDLASGKIQLSN